jgi:aspartate kinase
MMVFKFGGASVKDAAAVKNVTKILDLFPNNKVVVVVSAMGKTTNALEEIILSLWNKNENEFKRKLEEVKHFHFEIVNDLFGDRKADITERLEAIFAQIENRYEVAQRASFNFEYDQIVSLGEVISTRIVSDYLSIIGRRSSWMDAREIIRTNHTYREAEVDWITTEQLVSSKINKVFEENEIVLTQGFIGHTSDGYTTTLGREGSDFTAGILAYCLNAESVTIWKDVAGMLNADPRYFENTVKLDRISFLEAIELSYYGASVIHPKTVKPLQNKGIPLYVKSFIHPLDEGTIIQQDSHEDHLVPSFIFKKNQVLLSFTPRDFSFIDEKNLSDIFSRLARVNARINLMQNSALSFSVLLDEDKTDLHKILEVFENSYTVKFNEHLELVTIRHYDQKTIDFVCGNKEILLEQKTRSTARYVLNPSVS